MTTTPDSKTVKTHTTTLVLKRFKDCRGSVRFDAPKNPTTPNPIENVYVSRLVPGINEAREITVTIETPAP